MLPAEIFSILDKDALASLAGFFRQIASEIEDYRMKALDLENARHRIKFKALDRRASGEHALRLIQSGMAEPEAVVAASQAYDVTQAAAAYFLRSALKKSRAERNALILELARQGLRNEQIAQMTGLHPNTISRIIQKSIKMASLDRSRVSPTPR
ncbi:MAG: helix-turn-helix domain-containing protein [Alphaproteobacteria bacterium]|nr:helix-turn-helix domain-containing protein [Alphaproteobacteria bacterium]